MKLRNKKTGEIVDTTEWTFFCDAGAISIENDEDANKEFRYGSLAELNEEWEDYAPKEPLIKDEKIREIIGLWAKVNGVVELTYNDPENSLTDNIFRNEISFNGCLGLKDGCFYTTNELCGEEEE